MHVSSIHIKNVGQLAEFRADDIGCGLIGVVGRNGSGKSTVLGALCAALTGDWSLLPSGTKAGAVRDGCSQKDAFISIGLKFRDVSMTIDRPWVGDCSLTEDGRTVCGAAKIGARLSELGLTPKFLREFGFVPQGGCADLFRATPTKRATMLQALCGVEGAASIHAALGDQTRRLTPNFKDPFIDIGNLEMAIAESKSTIAALEAQLAEMPEEPPVVDAGRFARAKQAVERAAKIGGLVDDFDKAKAKLVACMAESTAVEAVDTAPAVAAANEARVAQAAAKSRLSSWESFQRLVSGAACPTCGTPSEVVLSRFENGDVSGIIAEAKKTLADAVVHSAACDKELSRVRALEAGAEASARRKRDASDAVQRIEQNLIVARSLPDSGESLDELRKAGEVRESWMQLRNKLELTLQAATTRDIALGDQIKDKRAQKAQFDRHTRGVALVTELAEHFHPMRGYPAYVIRRSLCALKGVVNDMLMAVGVGFSVKDIDDSLSFSVAIDGQVRPATSLSGGQLMLLGAYFWLATGKVFGDQLGFASLDEPTTYLDNDNVKLLAQSFARMRPLLRDRQVFVTSHHPVMESCFDQILRVGGHEQSDDPT